MDRQVCHCMPELLCLTVAGEAQTLLSLAFAPEQVTYSGTMSGDIYKWQGNTLAGIIAAAHKVIMLCPK